MLISLSNLTNVGKIQNNIWTKVRPLGVINMITWIQSNDKIRCYLRKWSIRTCNNNIDVEIKQNCLVKI